MLDPIQRRQYGITALLLAVLFLAVSVGAAVGNTIRRESVANDILTANQACEERLKILGASNVVRTDDRIVMNWSSLDAGYSVLGEASTAAMACPGWRMKKFCMGQECNAPGAILEMTNES